METKAIKTFDVEEGSIRGGWYRITVRFGDKVIETFTKRTMEEANNAFLDAGYEPISWAEGRKIILQDARHMVPPIPQHLLRKLMRDNPGYIPLSVC